MHRYFSFTLGPFDSNEAVSTLPGQLDLLSAFRDLGRQDVALIYRIRTTRTDDGSTGAVFSVLCAGETEDALTPSEAASLLDHAVVTFLPAWPVRHTDEDVAITARHRRCLAPVGGMWTALPIKSDWAPVVDLLRRREHPTTLELWCTVIEPEHVGAYKKVTAAHTAVGGADFELHAADYMQRVAEGLEDQPNERFRLALKVTLLSDGEFDEVFERLAGRQMLGVRVEPDDAEEVAFAGDTQGTVAGHPEEIIRVLHAPYGRMAGRGLDGFRPAHIPVRFGVPEANGDLVLGRAVRQGTRADVRVDIPLRASDRTRHTYVVGKTGSGKTNLLKNLVLQDVRAGRGVAVIDPHGDLVDYVAARCGDRAGEVVLLDFGDPTFVPAFNPLLTDAETQRDRDLTIEELLDVTIRRAYSEFTGPVFEDTVRMLLATVMSPLIPREGPPALALALEYMRDTDTARWVAKSLAEDRRLQQQWQAFNAMQGHTVSEHSRWVLSKFSDFTPGSVLAASTSAPGSPLSVDRVVSERGVLLIKIPESLVGPRAAALIGGLIFARLRRAALSQATVDGDPFALYVDEFQKFVNVELEALVAEARKFNFALTFAHQNLRQLEAFSRYEGSSSSRLREAIFSNVGTLVCMRTSGSDVAAVASELGLTADTVRRLDQYDALVRPVIDGDERMPFVLEIPNAEQEPATQESTATVRERMIGEGFWIDREAQEEAAQRAVAALRTAVEEHKRPSARRPNDDVHRFLDKRPHLTDDDALGRAKSPPVLDPAPRPAASGLSRPNPGSRPGANPLSPVSEAVSSAAAREPESQPNGRRRLFRRRSADGADRAGR